MFYVILYTLTAERESECSVSLIAQYDESGDSWLEACVVYSGHFILNTL